MIKKIYLYLFILALLILSFIGYILSISGAFSGQDNNIFVVKDYNYSILIPDGLKARLDSGEVVVISDSEEVATVQYYGQYSDFLKKYCQNETGCGVINGGSFLTLTGNSGEVVYFKDEMKDSSSGNVSNNSGPFFVVNAGDSSVIVVEPPHNIPVGEIDTVMQRVLAESIKLF